MLTVTWQLKPSIVTLHLLFGMTTLALLWWLMLSLPRRPPGARARCAGPGRSSRRGRISDRAAPTAWRSSGSSHSLVQIALGGWTSSNYAAHRLPGFPDLPGAWWPHTDFRQRIRAVAGTRHRLRRRRARQPGARRHPPHASPRGAGRERALGSARCSCCGSADSRARPRAGRCWRPSCCSSPSASRWWSSGSRCGWPPRTPRARRCCCWRPSRCCAH